MGQDLIQVHSETPVLCRVWAPNRYHGVERYNKTFTHFCRDHGRVCYHGIGRILPFCKGQVNKANTERFGCLSRATENRQNG